MRAFGRFLLYILVFTPLVFLPQFFVFPYIVPKVLAMRILILAIVGVAIVIGIAEKRLATVKTWLTPLAAVITVFLAAQVTSMIFGYDWYRSLWETHERMLGVFTVFHFVLLYFAARLILTTRSEWRRLWLCWLAAAAIVIGIGIIQKWLPNFLLNRGNSRVLSTLGNPIYLSAYGLFTFFVSLRYVFAEKRPWQWLWIAGAVLGLAGIYVGGGRGTMVGLLVALGAMTLLSIRLAPSARVRRGAMIVSGAGLILAGLFFGLRHAPAVQHLPVVGQLVNITTEDYTGRTRLLAWGVAIESFKDHPVLGWGPSNFYYAFSKHYNPAFLQFGFQETWFDNAHNVVFDSLATGGIVGVLAYLGLFVAAGYTMVRAFKKGQVSWSTLVISLGFLIAHFTHNLFVFENPSSYLALFLWFAWIDTEARPLPALADKYVKANASVMVPVGIIVVLVVLATQINVGAVAHADYTMRQLLSRGKVQEGLDLYEQSKGWHSPYIYDMEWDLASASINPLPQLYGSDKVLARRLYDTGAASMEHFIARYPGDVRARLAYMDVLRSGGMVLFELPVQSIVEENLRISEELSPGRQQVFYSKITYLAGTGHLEDAIVLARAQVEKEPTVGEGYYTLARLYAVKKDYYKIIDVLDRAILAGVHFSDPEQQGYAAQGYEREGRFRDALYWYNQMYQSTLDERVKNKRDELARQTQLAIPVTLQEFFPFARFVSSTPSL